MIKKDKRIDTTGNIKTYIRVVESYRPGLGANPKQRTIKSFGFLEEHENPAQFMDMVNEFNDSFKEDSGSYISKVPMYSLENRKLNYGYRFLESVYDMLEIDSFIKQYIIDSKFKGNYSLVEIFKFLVILRILNPDSKRATFQLKNNFYGMNTDFDLQDVYLALDKFADFEIDLQRHLNERVKATIGRDLSHAFYDVTNYFFEIDFPDGENDLRKKGVSKEHRTTPITSMGLFMDSNSLPVCMSIFPGNTSESLTLIPTIQDIKKSYELGRLILVADKGLNTTNNINAAVNVGDGYVFSQILKGKKGQRYHEKLFNPNDWIMNSNNTYKYKLFEEEYTGKDREGNQVVRKRKVLLYWSKDEAEMARKKREEKLAKASKSVKNNAYSIKKGVDEYTKENIVDKQTGEVLEDSITKVRSVNLEKAELDSLFDGYFCIITSELDYEANKIREVYHGLWKIEQSFRIMQTDLYARPVYVFKNEHIRAHFLICFAALLIIRIMQHKMGVQVISAERIARTLNAATLKLTKNGIVELDDIGGCMAFQKAINKDGKEVETLTPSDEDEIAQDFKIIQKLFKIDDYYTKYKQEHFNKLLKETKIALQ
jgi:transposase